MQMGMTLRQVLEDFDASRDHGRLQLHDGVFLQPRLIGEIARHATDSSRQTRIGVYLEAEALGFSGHGC